ncbi:MAG TPA: hypothetical protein VFJ02_20950 [Vicinamibacterales bacterium]|nr:hypothetical protein [Vicinamibacterales bacterium]
MMTTRHTVRKSLLAVASFNLKRLQRVFRRWSAPGSGPFLTGV